MGVPQKKKIFLREPRGGPPNVGAKDPRLNSANLMDFRLQRVQAFPLMKDYASIMLQAGTYTLIPNQYVPQR